MRLFDTHSFLLLMRSWCFLLLFMYSSVCTPLLFLNLIATLILKIWNYWGWKSPICSSIWIFKCLLGQVEMEKKEYVKSILKYFHTVNKNYTIIILYPYWILRQWNCLASTTLQNQNKQTNKQECQGSTEDMGKELHGCLERENLMEDLFKRKRKSLKLWSYLMK